MFISSYTIYPPEVWSLVGFQSFTCIRKEASFSYGPSEWEIWAARKGQSNGKLAIGSNATSSTSDNLNSSKISQNEKKRPSTQRIRQRLSSFAWENILRDCTTDFDSELIDTMD